MNLLETINDAIDICHKGDPEELELFWKENRGVCYAFDLYAHDVFYSAVAVHHLTRFINFFSSKSFDPSQTKQYLFNNYILHIKERLSDSDDPYMEDIWNHPESAHMLPSTIAAFLPGFDKDTLISLLNSPFIPPTIIEQGVVLSFKRATQSAQEAKKWEKVLDEIPDHHRAQIKRWASNEIIQAIPKYAKEILQESLDHSNQIQPPNKIRKV